MIKIIDAGSLVGDVKASIFNNGGKIQVFGQVSGDLHGDTQQIIINELDQPSRY